MRYWDASALVPLVVAESSTEQVRSWLREDAGVVTSAWTVVELTSAIERRVREGSLTRAQRRLVLDRFAAFATEWDEVTDVLAVRTHAAALLARHPLCAADAAQLASALLVRDHLGAGLTFVCLDERLSLAAELEGLAVLPQPAA